MNQEAYNMSGGKESNSPEKEKSPRRKGIKNAFRAITAGAMIALAAGPVFAEGCKKAVSDQEFENFHQTYQMTENGAEVRKQALSDQLKQINVDGLHVGEASKTFQCPGEQIGIYTDKGHIGDLYARKTSF